MMRKLSYNGWGTSMCPELQVLIALAPGLLFAAVTLVSELRERTK